jgi:hypothetical protein
MKLTAIASLIAAVIAGVSGWTANGWRLNAQIDRMVADHATQLATENAQALARYAAMEKQKQEAIDEENRIARRNAAAAAVAHADANRLREQIATASRVSTATVTSLRAYTTTLSTVFGECVNEIEGLAKAADGHALDSRTIRQAWPR